MKLGKLEKQSLLLAVAVMSRMFTFLNSEGQVTSMVATLCGLVLVSFVIGNQTCPVLHVMHNAVLSWFLSFYQYAGVMTEKLAFIGGEVNIRIAYHVMHPSSSVLACALIGFAGNRSATCAVTPSKAG